MGCLMPRLPENLVAYGGPLIPAGDAWLGLKPFSPEREERRRDVARKVVIGCAPLPASIACIETVSFCGYIMEWSSLESCVPVVARAIVCLAHVVVISAWVAIIWSSQQRNKRFILYVIFWIWNGLLPILLVCVDIAPSSPVVTRRVLAGLCTTVGQLLCFGQLSLGLTCMPLLGHSLYAISCFWPRETSRHPDDEDQSGEENENEQNGLMVAVLCIVLLVLCVCCLKLLTGCGQRTLSLWRASLRWPISLRGADKVIPAEVQRDLPDATVVGLQGETNLAPHFAVVLVAHTAEANGDTDSDLHSLTSDSSASSMDSDDIPLPRRRAAKEALLALYVLSRSAWGPDGRSLPLHLYTGVAECLGRQHFERHWREERDRMRELTRTLYHAEFEALLAAIERGGDEARDEVASTKSYASSVGSLTRIWKHLFRWFR
eukprot:TRINITY_DN18246_c1_g1_i3.p1 TRINITY_DN18246_c1_g1~~TRINITY_DN18246_c1_g1_i3.p1  ORF type:complete len:433 (-),score=21.42 TRINITY_DN18246_c1_g1_i3:219-1517(-)